MEIRITEDVRAEQPAKKVIGTQIPHELYSKLKEEADNEFMSISDLLRKIIFMYYAERKELK